MYYFFSLVVFHKPVALLSYPYRLPVAFLSQKNTLSLSCRSPVALLPLFPVASLFPGASLSPLALLPSCRLPFTFLSLILSLCLVPCCFRVLSLSPPCRPPVALLLPSCRSSPAAFRPPACPFLSLGYRCPAAGPPSSCRHPVVFLSPPCRLPVAPCRISPSPASHSPNLIITYTMPQSLPTGSPVSASKHCCNSCSQRLDREAMNVTRLRVPVYSESTREEQSTQ